MDNKELDNLFGIGSAPEDSGAQGGSDLSGEKPEEKHEEEIRVSEEGDSAEETAVTEAAEEDGENIAEEETDLSAEEEPEEPSEAPKRRAQKPVKPEGQGKRKVKRQTPAAPAKPTKTVSSDDVKAYMTSHRKQLIWGAVGILAVVIVCCVLFLPQFRVRNVTIEGNTVLTDEEIMEMCNFKYNAHLMSGVSGNVFDYLGLNYGKTEQYIKDNNPYVEDIKIKVKLPSTVYIEVKERNKIAYIKTPDGYAALDKNGIVLELSSGDDASEVRPLICGIVTDAVTLGGTVDIVNKTAYNKAIIVLGAILAADNASIGGDYSMFANTSEVRVLPSGYIFLTIYSPSGNLIQIKLNSTDSINEDMAWLLYAFNADAFDKVTTDGALDMTGDEYIYQEYR